MLKEVLLGEAVSRHLTGEKILAICEANGEFCTLSDILVGFRFLADDVPPVIEEAPEEEEDEEEEDTVTDVEEEESPPNPLDDEEYVKEVSKSKRKNEVDHGRIVALYTANPRRSVSWIADDMGCHPQTVINHLKAEGVYEPKRGGSK